MLPLERIESIDQQIASLLAGLPTPAPSIQTRQQLHAELAQFWADADSQGRSRRRRLADLRGALMHAELDLRLADQTLAADQADMLRNCLDLPAAWQRHHQPLARRPQVYRPVLKRSRPNWRASLPGMFVIVAGTAEGEQLDGLQATGPALLCGLAQGVEAYPSLADLHRELCERLDDPIQSVPLLSLLVDPQRIHSAGLADHLRYEWYADDPLQMQVDNLLEAQRQRVQQALAGTAPAESLPKAMALADEAGKRALLDTRYSLLLEKNLPDWLRSAGEPGLAHIMQTMQRLVAASESVATAGILTFAQFRQKHTLRQWATARVEERLRNDLGLTYPASDILVHVVHTQQVGPHLNPLQPSSYVTWGGAQKIGGKLIETIRESYPLDELALRNVNWFDYDYWLTARVEHRHSKPLPAALSAGYVKSLVRSLSVGGSYSDFLHKQLIDAPLGAWRLNAHAKVNRARMEAELVKARYARHLTSADSERDYRWVRQVLDHPHNALRPPVEGRRITVRQLTIYNHTLQSVLLIDSATTGVRSFVLYTPDAPDRRAWRSLANLRVLLRQLRSAPALLDYTLDRLPLVPRDQARKLFLKGGLGAALRMPAVDEELFHACYMAAARGMIAVADANSRSTPEADVEQGITLGWQLVDLISLGLPARPLMALSLGRMVMSIWDGIQAYRQAEIGGVLQHAYNALSHANDAGTSMAATGLMRRVLRGLPAQPPLPLPARYSVVPTVENLRYRIDGIYAEGVYEKASEFEGLSQYYIQDAQQRYYKIAFDGQRWRVVDPVQPDAYLKQPVKRLADGNWVIDSPVLWYDGVPDLAELLRDCLLPYALEGDPIEAIDGLHQADEQLYLQTRAGQVALRRHLLDDHFHLPIPHAATAGVVPWAILRWHDRQWRIRVRQAGRSSGWMALPEAYSVRRGSNRSSR